jgi:hypothetical protein
MGEYQRCLVLNRRIILPEVLYPEEIRGHTGFIPLASLDRSEASRGAGSGGF